MSANKCMDFFASCPHVVQKFYLIHDLILYFMHYRNISERMKISYKNTHTQTHTHSYIYIYIYIWLNNKDTFCLYNLIKIISIFLISVLISVWNWWMNLPTLSRTRPDTSKAIIRGCLHDDHLYRVRKRSRQCSYCTAPTTSGRPHGCTLVWACQWPSSQPLSSPQLSHNDSPWA